LPTVGLIYLDPAETCTFIGAAFSVSNAPPCTALPMDVYVVGPNDNTHSTPNFGLPTGTVYNIDLGFTTAAAAPEGIYTVVKLSFSQRH
jgi:hypothetical protein